MKLQDFRIGWRALAVAPAYSLVVVLGLGVGLAACLLLLGFVRFSVQYNTHIPDVDNVYVVKMRHNVQPTAPWFDQAPLLLRGTAQKTAGVVDVTGYISSRPLKTTARVNGQLRQLNSLTVLPGFAGMLGVRVLRGDLKAALERPEGFVMTEAAALAMFGTVDIIGKTMQIEGNLLRAGAVVATPPANTTVQFETLFGVNSLIVEETVRNEMLTGSRGWWAKLLVKVAPGASLPSITATLQQAVDAAPFNQNISPEVKARLGKRKAADIELSPLRYAYFDQKVAPHFIFAPGERADPVVVAGLAAIALLILVLAAINYVNLATVRVLRRQREIAMRKVLGAGSRQIALQFLAESMVVALLATGLGLLLAWLALPLFSQLVERQLDSMLSPFNIGAALVLGVLLGFVTAAYPAWTALRVQPERLLAGRPDTESVGGMRVRRVMTVAQVAAAMGLASVTMAIAWQTDFAMRAPPGFDPAPLLIVDLPEPVRFDKKAESLIAALKAQPEVAGVALSEDAVGRRQSFWTRQISRPGGVAVAVDLKSVSAGFFAQYRLKAASGRLFDERIDKDGDPVPMVLNAIAARELGFASPSEAVGQSVASAGFDGKVIHKRIVGIAPDLRYDTLHEAPRATAYELNSAVTTLTLRSRGPLGDTERVVRTLWPRYFPDAVLKTHRAADILTANYAGEARIANLLAVATGIALAIAAFGTYVLSAHTVQRRAKEIVLRKLHGARPSDIGMLVLREIGGLGLLAAAIALPLGALAIQRYLSTYVEHAPIGYWTLLLALGATLAVALAAVARHAWQAMRMSPDDILRP